MPYKDPEMHKLVQVYNQMMQRCYKETHANYHQYGGRGIYVTYRWQGNFRQFVQDMGPRPEGYWLERKDNDGPYSPENCVWVPPKQQQRNKRVTKLSEEKAKWIRAMWTAKHPFVSKQYFMEVVADVFNCKVPTIQSLIDGYSWR